MYSGKREKAAANSFKRREELNIDETIYDVHTTYLATAPAGGPPLIARFRRMGISRCVIVSTAASRPGRSCNSAY